MQSAKNVLLKIVILSILSAPLVMNMTIVPSVAVAEENECQGPCCDWLQAALACTNRQLPSCPQGECTAYLEGETCMRHCDIDNPPGACQDEWDEECSGGIEQ